MISFIIGFTQAHRIISGPNVVCGPSQDVICMMQIALCLPTAEGDFCLYGAVAKIEFQILPPR